MKAFSFPTVEVILLNSVEIITTSINCQTETCPPEF